MAFPTDEEIKENYIAFDMPTDQIAQRREYLKDFGVLFNLKLTTTNLDRLSKRLIQLRKMGKLPKIRNGQGPRKGYKKRL